MPTQFEAFVICPRTNEEVSTGYVVARESFDPSDKTYGTFNCALCREAHVWSTESAKVRLVVK